MPNKFPALLVVLALCLGVTAAAQAPPTEPPPILWCSTEGCVAMYPRLSGDKVLLVPSLPPHGEPRRLAADTVCWPWQGRHMPDHPYRLIRSMPPGSTALIREADGGMAYCHRQTKAIFSDGFESGDTSAWSEGKQ